ncbi:hypothetical protein ACFLXC_00765 [Chloroflexota bacterium]
MCKEYHENSSDFFKIALPVLLALILLFSFGISPLLPAGVKESDLPGKTEL